MIDTRTAATVVVVALVAAGLIFDAYLRGPKDDNDPSQHNRRRPGE